MAPFHLLEPKEEDELHKVRLLNVEEKPFKRITKRMQTLHAAAKWGKSQAPVTVASPTATDASQRPNGTAAGSRPPSSNEPPQQSPQELQLLREELTLDFAAFDNTVARLQFLMRANAEERERYGADREAIVATCQDVRENNGRLRAQLDDARATLEQRKKFDALAERITSNRMLRSRAEQARNLEKLEEECAQLEGESEQYAVTWRERRDQFARIMDEALRLRRQIRDEKDEVDRREGMGEDEAADPDAHTPRPGVASGNATPQPHGAAALPPRILAGLAEGQEASSSSRPGSSFGGRTPARDSPAPHDSLKPRPEVSGSFTQDLGAGMSAPPSGGDDDAPNRGGEDVEMDDAGGQPAEGGTPDNIDSRADDTPRTTVDGQQVVEEKMDTT